MIRKSLVLFAALFFAVSAHAQLAAYGTVTVVRLSGISSSPYASSFAAGAIHDNVNPLGGTFGLYYDFKNLGPFRLGIDARGSILSTKRGAETAFDGSGSRIYSTLGGLRGSFHTPVKFIDGYIQASAGLGRSDYGFPPAVLSPTTKISTVNNFEYHGFAGMQIHISPIADFRAFEIGYGGLEGGSHNYPIKSISTGVVFHFPAAQ